MQDLKEIKRNNELDDKKGSARLINDNEMLFEIVEQKNEDDDEDLDDEDLEENNDIENYQHFRNHANYLKQPKQHSE